MSSASPDTDAFEAERHRLLAIASRVLADDAEAEDVVQQAWLRLHRATEAGTRVEDLPAWLTTVTTRLCLDRLRARTPVPTEDLEVPGTAADPVDPADEVVLAEGVGLALHVVLDRLAPRERVALVLHDGFGVALPTVAAILETTPANARQLASRARRTVGGSTPGPQRADQEVVDAFMAAARAGEFAQLLALLHPDAEITADAAAVLVGTPERISGRQPVATFLNGSARAALPVLVDGRPGAAWFQRGEARVLFDFTLDDGLVRAITFRADPDVLARVVRRP